MKPQKSRTKREVPVRTCIVSREDKPASELLRIILGPDGSAYPVADRHKDDGRGAWVTPTLAAVGTLVNEPKRLARALKAETVDTSALLERARALVEARVLDFLSLSSRSGRLASGAEMATAAVRAGDAVALLVASDASAGSLSDIKGSRELPVFVLGLDREQFGQRIGKGARAVVALRPGGPAEDLVMWLGRRAALAGA